MPPCFIDRADAGRQLAARLALEPLPPPIVVLALPRGGVPIGTEVARRLGAPLDLLLVRKIGAPWQRELAVAAVVEGDGPEVVIDEETLAASGASPAYVQQQAKLEWREIERRRARYLQGRARPALAGATVVVVDDGIATGTTVRAALQALRRRAPGRLVLAVPVAPRDTLAWLAGEVDQLVCLATPEPFHAVGPHYRDFHQVEDDEVIAALDAAAGSATSGSPRP
ncbi:MAG: phosphoribosyltransferase [Rubrivivax sp.]|jgi:putative phosphoribosyl transferase|nr:phosphoribosyltransferase [Rubrivivax sp.]